MNDRDGGEVGGRWLEYGMVGLCLCLVDCCHSHQRLSSQLSPASPGHPSGPLNTYQAHPRLPLASSASESTHLHAGERGGKWK